MTTNAHFFIYTLFYTSLHHALLRSFHLSKTLHFSPYSITTSYLILLWTINDAEKDRSNKEQIHKLQIENKFLDDFTKL